MGVNKVEFGGEALVDLTSDTVNEQSLLSGYTAHNRAGELIEGLAVIPTKLSQLENDAGYAKTESPAFTGIPTAPTPPDSTNSTQIATTAYVKRLIANLVNGAPETLDTLKEIADALGENDDAVQALNAAIGNKVDKVAGKGLSTNDFTTAEKNKLTGIATGANKTTYTNNLAATVAGTALDAVQGKALNDKGTQMNVYVGDDGNLHFKNWAGADTVIHFNKENSFTELVFLGSKNPYPSTTFSGLKKGDWLIMAGIHQDRETVDCAPSNIKGGKLLFHAQTNTGYTQYSSIIEVNESSVTFTIAYNTYAICSRLTT